MIDRPLLPSSKCSNAYEVWHDDLSSIYYRGDCCDHAPLGPAERKGIHEDTRRFFENRFATTKRPRGY